LPEKTAPPSATRLDVLENSGESCTHDLAERLLTKRPAVRAKVTFSVGVLPILVACHPGPHLRQPRAPAQWIEGRGGLARDPALHERAELARKALLGDTAGSAVAVHVLDTDAALAFSWPSGELFLTRKLVQALSSDELAAVIAHELGHLEAAGHVGALTSLAGTTGDARSEEDADLRGYRLLESRGLGGDAMTRMLRAVMDLSDGETRASMARRIDSLERACSSRPGTRTAPPARST
jgi:hypothetical protein